MDKRLNSLLSWGVDPTARPPDPEALAQLFGGADEATQMREAVVQVTNEAAPLEAREGAFDNLEMLVERLDNANNLKVLGLWTPILSLLQPSHPPSLRQLAAWVCSTAVQNNAHAQKDFMEAGGLAQMLRVVREDTEDSVCAKAVSALNSELHNNVSAQEQFAMMRGWQSILDLAVRGGNMMKKSLFMLATVLAEEGACERASITNLQQTLRIVSQREDLDEDMRTYCKRIQSL